MYTGYYIQHHENNISYTTCNVYNMHVLTYVFVCCCCCVRHNMYYFNLGKVYSRKALCSLRVHNEHDIACTAMYCIQVHLSKKSHTYVTMYAHTTFTKSITRTYVVTSFLLKHAYYVTCRTCIQITLYIHTTYTTCVGSVIIPVDFVVVDVLCINKGALQERCTHIRHVVRQQVTTRITHGVSNIPTGIFTNLTMITITSCTWYATYITDPNLNFFFVFVGV